MTSDQKKPAHTESFPHGSRSGAAALDWVVSLKRAPLWSNLALEDLRDRYRRTVFGLLWVVLSFVLFVIVKITIFGQMTAVSATEFGLFVTFGFGLWTYISSVVMDACTALIHARPWILGTSTPYPVYLLQAVFRNWLTFMMILVVMLLALYWKPTPWNLGMLSAVPALAAYLVASLWVAAILAPLCVRFRDLHHAVQTAMRLIFFATPILWMPSTSGRLAMIANFNPISHFIAIVREPLIYGTIPWESWRIVLLINLIGLPLGFFTYARTRLNVVYWI